MTIQTAQIAGLPRHRRGRHLRRSDVSTEGTTIDTHPQKKQRLLDDGVSSYDYKAIFGNGAVAMMSLDTNLDDPVTVNADAISILQDEVDANDGDISFLQAEVMDNNEEISLLTVEAAETDGDMASLMNMVTDIDNEITSLQNQVAQNTGDITALQDENNEDAANSDIASLEEAKFSSLSDQFAAFKDMLTTYYGITQPPTASPTPCGDKCGGDYACSFPDNVECNSCNNYASCHANNDFGTVGRHSCNSYQSCRNLPSTASVGIDSCNPLGADDAYSCYYLGEGVEIGDTSCLGQSGCNRLEANVIVGDNSCHSEAACRSIAANVIIGSNACQGYKACCGRITDVLDNQCNGDGECCDSNTCYGGCPS